MKKVLINFIIIILSIFIIGCSNNNGAVNNIVINEIENIKIELPVLENENNIIIVENNQIEEVVELEEVLKLENIEEKIFSKITGLEITEEESKMRPIAVMLDNQYKARPQAGLSEAEVIYEILAEGSITRYMAIFQTKKPDVIGPVRSSRPYFIERALEFNPRYVHVGGSMQALSDIINYQMADIDGLSVASGVFYRTDHKYMPHNAYSSYDGIIKEATRKNYFTEVDFSGMPISSENYFLDGNNASKVIITYKSPSSSDSIGYFVSFDYDETEMKYFRYVNNEKHLDEESKIRLYADNIIIQKTVHKVIDNEGRKQINMISNGNGYYINKGKYIPITWEKISAYSQTKYYKNDGSELTLNPGVTWIQVIPTTSEPIIK